MFNHFARHEQGFADWRWDGYPGVKAETYQYIDFLSDADDDQAPREGTLWAHQWEAFLRVVYSHEILGKTEIGAKGLLLNIGTLGLAWGGLCECLGLFVVAGCPGAEELR